MADPNVSPNLAPGRRRALGRAKPSRAALAGIRARGKAKSGRTPSDAAVMATYARNQERARAKAKAQPTTGTRGERSGQRRSLPRPPGFVSQQARSFVPPGQAKKAAGARSARGFAPGRVGRGSNPPMPLPRSGSTSPGAGSSSRFLGPPTPFPSPRPAPGASSDRLIGPPVGGSGTRGRPGTRGRLGNPSRRREGSR